MLGTWFLGGRGLDYLSFLPHWAFLYSVHVHAGFIGSLPLGLGNSVLSCELNQLGVFLDVPPLLFLP